MTLFVKIMKKFKKFSLLF